MPSGGSGCSRQECAARCAAMSLGRVSQEEQETALPVPPAVRQAAGRGSESWRDALPARRAPAEADRHGHIPLTTNPSINTAPSGMWIPHGCERPAGGMSPQSARGSGCGLGLLPRADQLGGGGQPQPLSCRGRSPVHLGESRPLQVGLGLKVRGRGGGGHHPRAGSAGLERSSAVGTGGGHRP